MFQSSHSSVFILLLLATAGTSFNFCESSVASANVSLQVDCYESKILFKYNWKGEHDLLFIHSPNPTCYLSNGTEIAAFNSEVTIDAGPGSKLTYNDTITLFLQGTQFPLETGAYCNWMACMLVRINETLHFYNTSEEYSCRLKREVTITSSPTDQLLTTTDNYDILATTDTSTPMEIIVTAGLTSQKGATTSGYYIITEMTNVKSSSMFPSAEGTYIILTGIRSTKNGLSSSSNGGQTPTITNNPITRGHQTIVTYTLTGVMILILGFSLTALVMSCMSIKRRKESRRTAQISSMNELHTVTCHDIIEESRHKLSLYKDNHLNGSVVTLLHSLDSSTRLCKASCDKATKLKESGGDGERYMMTGLSINQDSDEYKRLAKSLIELRYTAGNTAGGQKNIMELSNRLIYDNLLCCASEDIARATMSTSGWSFLEIKSDWLAHAIDPNNNVVFLNTDKLGTALEENTSDHMCNTFEVKAVVNIITTLVQLGISPSDILAITQYKSQERLMNKWLQKPEANLQTS
uniref:DNA2/NAM7 helicase-like C-terminal domain-containing protein n=1 Tax=Amphimedon queenslandica TaxID=400682 RepID=A0A1X7UUF8_AMPQE